MRTATAVTTGPWVRLLLLLGTLVGLTAMHTLGHGAHAGGGPTGHAVGGHAAPPAVMVATTGDCPGGDCGHARMLPLVDAHARALPLVDAHARALPLVDAHARALPLVDAHARALPLVDAHARALPLGELGGDGSGWSICLAVLGAFAVTLLVALLLGARSGAGGPTASRPLRPAPGPRAPPPRPYGLRLTTVSVLRR
ncbi:hypothetical protein ONA91_08440 [Micromonospora sp. DR5-3]|uniref:hypothetical protein n=1 Tax=unclassified Micromonospora TaxID=2617518 RepID=UPI0011DC3A3B|nr:MULTISPECIES: hypothetical protein [unclassified Micromonospora]MCW3814484.1 hypothetical protein [Micromonospora sp. DR5-3]TYC22702.1 hypothetical protein FXF52_19520 [Micromonospora sp. MP36]